MNKQIKKLLCSALSIAMIAGSIVLPISASAEEFDPIFAGDTVLKEWKFEFGAEGTQASEGYTLVTPDVNFVDNTGVENQYGFLGTTEDDYLLTNRYDGWTTQQGQVIELASGENGGIGVVGAGGTGDYAGADAFGNKADKYYPLRFAMKVPDDTYYRVKATVTTLDPTKAADVSLYTERKHPLYTHKTIAAGQTHTETFSVRVTPLYYQKSDPTGVIADQMLTVGVLGENSALVSLDIQQVETLPVFWILGDSTVTDGNTVLPWSPMSNYTGVGTGFTKYLPRNIAMVNEGEGGLNAGDSSHLNIVKSRIKAGDYLYVEYGHNHKDTGGPDDYISCLNRGQYYEKCHEVGATLIIASPIERINTWSSSEGKYDYSHRGYAEPGAEWVAAKASAGDIAFVDMNKATLDKYNEIVAANNNDANAIKFYFQTAKGGGTDATHPNDMGADVFAKLFFDEAEKIEDATQKAAIQPLLDGMTNETPNLVPASDMAGGLGGSAWPQYVVQTAEKYPCLIKDIVFDENGTAVSAEVAVRASQMNFGSYGVVVITVYDKDGEEKGKIQAKAQVDNSTGYGTQIITNFTTGVTLGEGDTYTAVVVEGVERDENGQTILDVKEDGLVYSAVYKPTDIAEHLILNQKGDGPEDFNFVGANYDGTDTLEGKNDWKKRGSAGMDLKLGTDNGVKYATLHSNAEKNGAAKQGSCYISKDLAKPIGTTGRYMVSFDLKYISGNGVDNGNKGMVIRLVTGNTDSAPWGTGALELFYIADTKGTLKNGDTELGNISATGFTNVQAILDLDLGTMEVSVGGGDATVINLANYQTTGLTVEPAKLTSISFEANRVAFENRISSLTVAKLKDKELPKYTVTAIPSNSDYGSVDIGIQSALKYSDGKAIVNASEKCVLIEAQYENGIIKSITPTTLENGKGEVPVTEGSKLMLWNSLEKMKPLADAINAVESEDKYTLNTVMTAKAQADEGYVFMGWYNGNELASMDAEYKFRLRGDTVLSAKIVPKPTLADITDFKVSASPASIKSRVGSTANLHVSDAVDANKTPMDEVTESDLIWSCTENGISISEDGVLTIGEGFSMGEALTKMITVNGKINNVSRSCTITVFGYEYYEDMTEGATQFDGTFVTLGGKKAIAFPGASSTSHYTMSEAVALDAVTTLKYTNMYGGTQNNTCGQKRSLVFKNSAGATLFSLYYDWATLKADNGTSEIPGAVANNAYQTVAAVIDPTEKTVTVTIEGKTETITVPLADNAGDIAGIDFVCAASVPGPDARSLGISNITIIK